MEGLKWVIELMDRASGPARAVAKALDNVRVAKDRVAKGPDPLAALERASGQRRGRNQARLGRELEQLAKAQRQGAGESSMFSGALMGVGGVLLGVAAAALAAAVAIGGVGIAGARSAVELAGFQESTMVSMQTMLGSRGAAEAELDSSIRIARLTPFDTRNVVSMRRQLLGAGLRDSRERDVMTGVIADLSALNPEDSGVMQRLGLAIGQVRGAGRLRGQELNQLVQAGMSREALFTEIGSAMNLRGTPAAVNRQVASLMEQGRITDRIAFAAMARAVTRMTNTTEVGQFAANQSTTIPGLLSTLGSAVPELLLGRGADGTRLFESKGMSAFKGLLQSVIGLLSSDSPSKTGQRLQLILRGLIDSVFGLSRALKPGDLAAGFHRVLDAVQWTIGAVGTLFKWGQALGGGYWSVLGPVLQGVGDAASWVIEQMGGSDAQGALDVMRAIGQVLAVVFVASLIPLALLVVVVGTLAYAFYKVGQGIGWVLEQLTELARRVLPNWALPMLGIEPGPALSGATPIVDQGRNPNAGRPVVSQPNVNVMVNAQSAAGVTPEEIAAAAGAAIPGVVQAAADRASRQVGQ